MKLAEALYERKKTESKILRLMEYRKAVFSKNLPEIRDETPEKREERQAKFFEKQRKEIASINKDIEFWTTNYVDLAHKITDVNLQLNVDSRLIEMKFLRIELASLDKLMKGRYLDSMDIERIKALEIDKRLDAVEERKRKLDAKIQMINNSNDITL